MRVTDFNPYLAAGLLWAAASALLAATHTVEMLGGPNRFAPQNLTVNVGDTVTWINHDPDRPHSTTSNSGEWESDLLFEDDTFSHTFDSAGVYGYYGAYGGMTGQITVLAPNTAPNVAIAAPANNAVYAAPASVVITANASDPDGSVTNVSFYAGASLVGSRSQAPFSVTASNLPLGAVALTARATDNHGLMATSAPVTIHLVVPAELRLLTPVATGPQVRVSYATTPQLTYVLESTTNLAGGWRAVQTNVASSSVTTVTNPAPPSARQFFRAYLAR